MMIKKNMLITRKNSKGKTLVEYLLFFSIIAVVAVPSLIALGNTLKTSYEVNSSKTKNKELLSILDPKPKTAIASSSSTSTGSTGTSSATTTNSPPLLAGQEQVCFGSGFCINVPIVSDGNIVETAGGLGGDQTKAFANVLLQLVSQLEADGAKLHP